jgi:sigma-E factor negative regulatory protein RseC
MSGDFENIEHNGTVQKSDNKSVTVKITSESACSGCQAGGSCTLAGREEKIIEVQGTYNVNPGDNVTVLMKKSMGYSAVLLGYVLPFILVITVLIVLVSAAVPEAAAGIGSIAVLIPYYLTLWFFKKRINNKFTFTIKS